MEKEHSKLLINDCVLSNTGAALFSLLVLFLERGIDYYCYFCFLLSRDQITPEYLMTRTKLTYCLYTSSKISKAIDEMIIGEATKKGE
jgi:hypothetical protein